MTDSLNCFQEWYSKLSKPEKRMIAIIWFSLQVIEHELRNPIWNTLGE